MLNIFAVNLFMLPVYKMHKINEEADGHVSPHINTRSCLANLI
jgi:hypothetical protein